MATPPPTETPAPLSDDEIERLVGKVADDGWKFGSETVANLLATISALRTRNEALTAEKDELAKQVYVPGLWKCAKCKCTVVSTLIDANSGRFAANHEPQQCPNDCGPMWRVTEREGGNNVADALDRMLERAEAAESTIARHVAALQEIGKGVEADQATIARLTEQLEDAESDADNDRAAWAAAREGIRQVRALFAKHAGIEERMDWRDWIVATEAHLSTIARLREALAQADAFVALNCDHHGQVWTRQVMGIAEREDMITRHRARHDTEGR